MVVETTKLNAGYVGWLFTRKDLFW